MFDPDCVFCTEVVEKRNAEIVYEDENTMAFLDHAPVEDGHLLVIPKKHFVNILDIDMEDFLRVQQLVRKLCQPVMNALGCDAINIGQNNGPCANQVVMHYHVHIIPRWCDSSSAADTARKGNRRMNDFISRDGRLNWERKRVSRSDLEVVASRIREELARSNLR